MELGAQLYTVRNYIQTEEDFERTINKIADIGYRYIQISGVGKGISPERLREICDSHGVKTVLTHSDINRILYDTENLIKEHDILGSSYIGLGAMPEKYRGTDWLSYFYEDFKEPVKKIAASGKLFMYHNHNFEFEKENGVTLLERLLELFKPQEMGITLDTYWVQAAGADVISWIGKLKDRLPCVHLKDMAVVSGNGVMAPVGEGNLNFPGILEALKETNCEYLLVEQDTCQTSPFQCLRQSYENLKKLGYE
ncbi:sugar phosphate isomerase/epimerase family protein [Anaerocolumna jejuensis]|uniref:sugar phosphate isomerase/epimerase family protein n=1 Tax=Anaerocolumna jejuensis TaxID=259063 RepID=UPI003F7C7A38